MDSFTIADLQSFSGVKAHTIRIWEQRYNALQPGRSEGNTRFYNAKQLKRLLNIVSLMNKEHRVSELCMMPDEQLLQLLNEKAAAAESTVSHEYYVSQLVSAGVLYDEATFDKLFSNSILRFGVRNTYIHVIQPALERMGLWWARDKLHPAQEHFITNLFRQKLYAAIDSLPPPPAGKETWLLFLPESEFHETGLLYANFLLRHSGKKVIYLGENIPLDSLRRAADETGSRKLLFFLVRANDQEEDEQLLKFLEKNFADCSMYVACKPGRLNGITAAKRFIQLHTAACFEKLIASNV